MPSEATGRLPGVATGPDVDASLNVQRRLNVPSDKPNTPSQKPASPRRPNTRDRRAAEIAASAGKQAQLKREAAERRVAREQRDAKAAKP